MNVNTSINSI
jgi:putative transposase